MTKDSKDSSTFNIEEFLVDSAGNPVRAKSSESNTRNAGEPDSGLSRSDPSFESVEVPDVYNPGNAGNALTTYEKVGISSRAAAKALNVAGGIKMEMANFLKEKFGDGGELSISQLEENKRGINTHFIVSYKNGDLNLKYHAKAPLSSTMSGTSIINELFIYKVLDKMGYGPKEHSLFLKDPQEERPIHNLVIVTEDLSNDNPLKPGKKSSFETHYELTSQGKTDDVSATDREEELVHLTCCFLLGRILHLGDLQNNNGNAGNKTSITELTNKKKSFIIDFKPIMTDAVLSIKKAQIDNIFAKLSELLSDKSEIKLEFVDAEFKINPDILLKSFDRILNGKESTSRMGLRDALQAAGDEINKSCKENFKSSSGTDHELQFADMAASRIELLERFQGFVKEYEEKLKEGSQSSKDASRQSNAPKRPSSPSGSRVEGKASKLQK